MKAVQMVQNVQSVQAPTSFLPRVAGEDEAGGWNDLNDWNDWNYFFGWNDWNCF
jgi:hypothetical protein